MNFNALGAKDEMAHYVHMYISDHIFDDNGFNSGGFRVDTRQAFPDTISYYVLNNGTMVARSVDSGLFDEGKRPYLAVKGTPPDFNGDYGYGSIVYASQGVKEQAIEFSGFTDTNNFVEIYTGSTLLWAIRYEDNEFRDDVDNGNGTHIREVWVNDSAYTVTYRVYRNDEDHSLDTFQIFNSQGYTLNVGSNVGSGSVQSFNQSIYKWSFIVPTENGVKKGVWSCRSDRLGDVSQYTLESWTDLQ